MQEVKNRPASKKARVSIQGSIPWGYFSELIAIADSRGLTRSQIAREALMEYLDRRR